MNHRTAATASTIAAPRTEQQHPALGVHVLPDEAVRRRDLHAVGAPAEQAGPKGPPNQMLVACWSQMVVPSRSPPSTGRRTGIEHKIW
jgi:hypothetical protein